ncbi:hypothetical protein [Janibacter massiliensis]|uniref:hypothetical protein n=1 Tax=Janibacter massiliensis TaxID=2058291 RepID=UPI000D1102E8|nr:hypothetical protein [Janibacter massiliensis]
MLDLPAAVRLALWATVGWNRPGVDPAAAAAAGLAVADDVAGLDAELVAGLHALGERAALAVLPEDGAPSPLLRAPAGVVAEVVDAGGAVLFPMTGTVLVVAASGYGPAGDRGTRIQVHRADADPVPRHRVEALDVRESGRALASDLREATLDLERIGGTPFVGALVDDLRDSAVGASWGLPPGIDRRALETITRAGTVVAVCDAAVSAPSGALTAVHHGERDAAIRRLRGRALRHLEDATNAAVAIAAGWRS